MADSTLNRFVGEGDDAQEAAFTPDPPTPASGPDSACLFVNKEDPMNPELKWWDGSAFLPLGGGGSGDVTASGTLTSGAVIVGGGTTVVAATATGTGVVTALGVNVGSAGAVVVNGGALGTPSSGTLTNATGLPGSGLTNASVTLAKIQNAAANSKLLGSGAAGSGASYAELTLGTNLSMSGTTLNATGGGSGVVVQVVNTQTGAAATGSTLLPFDDSIPQNTEGDEYMTLAVTPTDAANKLKIDVVFFGTSSHTNWITVALFQDSTAGALAAFCSYQTVATAGQQAQFTHTMTAGTTSATTFKVRAGRDASNPGTVTFNGQSGGRMMGGVMSSSITITEYVP